MYAPAYSGIADASALLASWQFAASQEMYPQAAAAAQRAIELDPSSADAHASLGFVKLNWEWDWDGALRELGRAIELNPSHETAHRWLSAFLAGIGRDDDALRIARRAAELDPISVLPHMNLAIVHMLAGRYDESEAEFRYVLEKDPTFVRAVGFRAWTLSLLGRHDEALALARTAVELTNQHVIFLYMLGTCLARSGQMDEARKVFGPILNQLDPLYVATAHTAMGEESAALDALERCPEVRSDWMYSVGTQPLLRPYHSHPRFIALLERLHLPPVDSSEKPRGQ
jgi:tetratricopeptide (TPR) repeat protein